MTAKAAERAALSRRWEQATEWPLMVAAVAFLAAYAVPILDPGLPSWLLEMCRWLSWITWGIFVVRLSLGRRAAPVPRPALVRRTRDSPSPTPAAAPAPVDPTTLGAESTGQVATARPGGDLRSRGAAMLALCGSLAVLDAERSSPDANITDFGDASWWAVTTMTTVGYGDRYPVTGVGRLAAFGLMVGGIALLGTVTATLASWLVEAVAAEKDQAEDLQATVRRLEAKVDLLAAQQRHDTESASTSIASSASPRRAMTMGPSSSI
jgi:voltage-gated potassium channel